jgi:hypothetical protein
MTTRNDFYNARTVFQNAFNFQSDDVELSRKMIPFFKEVFFDVINPTEDKKQELINQFAIKDKFGKIKTDQNNMADLGPNKELFATEMQKVLDEEIKFKNGKFPWTRAVEMKMTPAELVAIEFILGD